MRRINQGRRRFAGLAAGLLLGGLARPVLAQAAWPAQAIRLVVAFPPGGASDLVARLLQADLSRELGVPIVVENKPGAGSTLGTAQVALSAPDGYTFLMSNSAPLSIAPALLDHIRYDARSSFSHISYIGAVPTVVLVHPSLPVHTLAELTEWLRAQKEPVHYGSGGLGSVAHVVGELYARQAGVRLEHVAYKGAGQMRTDLLGGQIRVAVDALPANLPFLKTGQLRLLAVTAPARVAQAPDVPAVTELGYETLVAENFVGVSAPAGLDPAIVQRFHQAVERVLAKADIRAQLEQQGFVLASKTPDEFQSYVARQAEQWRPVVSRLKGKEAQA